MRQYKYLSINFELFISNKFEREKDIKGIDFTCLRES